MNSKYDIEVWLKIKLSIKYIIKNRIKLDSILPFLLKNLFVTNNDQHINDLFVRRFLIDFLSIISNSSSEEEF
ncbi:hypothetical protein BpHYR1_050722 [Brachionus plicatilis]|uniref:Uncharacterized protein n=1 Tax=Brachionus plicatilis TaxID=10195 RepID=A0A3M7PFN7_BRAPC|nr:hypothetical protein BpHYR1_050722 [Brachionus plicatilis]